MINIVEKAYSDLGRLGEQTELYNGTTISIIEQSMPLDMKNEWVKAIVSKQLNSKQKFEELMELMRDWRNRLEYLSASIREVPERHFQKDHVDQTRIQQPRKGCWLHNMDGGHPIWRCKLFISTPVQQRMNLVFVNKA